MVIYFNYRRDKMPLLPGIYEILFIIIIVSWVLSLIDIYKSNFRGNYKIMWLLLLIFIPPIAILYVVIGKKTKKG